MRGVLNPSFSRPPSDWEIEMMEYFLARIQEKVVDVSEIDKVGRGLRMDCFLPSLFMLLLRRAAQSLHPQA